ncbi:MAG: YMGG-like glycine zipper-containing protein [Candidatus Omnitrophica bacterium]|nr:YMGG-like glycine zipper-containing protein [Candidatus Omnitrophota bacterium]
MKRILILFLCAGLALLTLGCQGSQTRSGEGAVIGGLLGATAGGIVGHQSHHGLEGAAIGAAAGALTGAIVGGQIQKPGQPAQTTGTTVAANPNQMTILQIVELSKQGANENVIIDKIRLSNSKFNLTSDDISYLKQQGVSQNVINAMQGR